MKKRRKRKQPTGLTVLVGLLVLIALFVFVLPKVHKRMSYPVRYRDMIEEFAEAYSLDAALVASIVNTESSYNARATSPVGARGLMQVMPSTGEWIHGKLKKPYAFDAEVLYTVDGALTYGCWYLDFLMERFDGDRKTVVAAYHAGQGVVEKWLKNPAYSWDGKKLDLIPEGAQATRHYVEKVQKAYEYYKKVYETHER